jgi:hypothetical protein
VRTLLIAALIGAGMTLATPASADIGDGPATVTLDECAEGASRADTYLPDCSFVHLVGKGAPSYTYVASQGPVTWTGSTSQGLLSFPAAGQTWRALTGITWTPKDIAGTVAADGRLRLAMQYEVRIDVSSAGTCSLSGIVELTSQGTELRSGQAVGQNWDPATGRFAVVSTSAYPAIPALTTSCLRLAATDYALLQGASWFLTGTMGLPDEPAVAAVRTQMAKVKLPRHIKAEGKTVLLKRAVRTNAGQKARARVTWSKGSAPRFASVKTTKAGRVTITTTGKAKRLRVTLTLRAKARGPYQAYATTRTWLVTR